MSSPRNSAARRAGLAARGAATRARAASRGGAPRARRAVMPAARADRRRRAGRRASPTRWRRRARRAARSGVARRAGARAARGAGATCRRPRAPSRARRARRARRRTPRTCPRAARARARGRRRRVVLPSTVRGRSPSCALADERRAPALVARDLEARAQQLGRDLVEADDAVELAAQELGAAIDDVADGQAAEEHGAPRADRHGDVGQRGAQHERAVRRAPSPGRWARRGPSSVTTIEPSRRRSRRAPYGCSAARS